MAFAATTDHNQCVISHMSLMHIRMFCSRRDGIACTVCQLASQQRVCTTPRACRIVLLWRCRLCQEPTGRQLPRLQGRCTHEQEPCWGAESYRNSFILLGSCSCAPLPPVCVMVSARINPVVVLMDLQEDGTVGEWEQSLWVLAQVSSCTCCMQQASG